MCFVLLGFKSLLHFKGHMTTGGGRPKMPLHTLFQEAPSFCCPIFKTFLKGRSMFTKL